MIIIKRLVSGDEHLLLASEAFDNRVDPEQARRFLADDGHEIVAALDGNEVIGFASGTILLHPDKQPAFLVAEVGVDEEYQRQGIATKLVAEINAVARNRGCKGIWLATEVDNEPARGLYKKLQAQETEGIVVYDWDGAMNE